MKIDLVSCMDLAGSPLDANTPSRFHPNRDTFSSDQVYGWYIKANLRVGMQVRARVGYESVTEGDIGIYKQTNEYNPPAQFAWDGFCMGLAGSPPGANTPSRFYHQAHPMQTVLEDDHHCPACRFQGHPPRQIHTLLLPSHTYPLED